MTYTIEQKKKAIESTFYPVEKVDALNAKTGRMEKVLRDASSGRVLTTVSDRYEVVQNRDVIQPFVEHFGVDRLTFCKQFNRQYMYKFETGRTFTMPDERYSGDVIKEQLIVSNSYDKSRAFSFMFGAFRLVCTNGLYTGTMTLGYKKIHVGTIPVGDIVQSALSNYSKNSFDAWFEMAKKHMTLEEQYQVLAGFRPFEEKKEDANSAWHDSATNKQINNRIQSVTKNLLGRAENADNQRNAWGLYNQMNRAISRVVSIGSINKVILGNKRAEEFVLAQIGKEIN